jgi:predicted alpha/beta hydrolase family esterase
MLSKYRFVIIHGAYGFPGENWFPWLAEQLKKKGAKAIVPTFPTPEGQTLDTWLNVFNKEVGKLDNKTVLIGHSLGTLFILRVLERAQNSIKAAFLVSSLANRELGIPDFDNIKTTFVAGDVDWEKIRSKSEAFYVYHSDNDPYIQPALGLEVAINLRTDLRIIHNGGHINTAAGFTKFDRLLVDIENFVK